MCRKEYFNLAAGIFALYEKYIYIQIVILGDFDKSPKILMYLGIVLRLLIVGVKNGNDSRGAY